MVLKWVADRGRCGWLLLSFVAFAISSQLQKWKLSGDAKSALDGDPFLLFSPQTILVIGTDARPPGPRSPEPRRLGEVPRPAGAWRAPHVECSEGRSAPTR